MILQRYGATLERIGPVLARGGAPTPIAMKTSAPLLIFLLAGATLHGQDAAPDSTGLPGDHFSLEAALDLFKKSKDLGSFEQALNQADTKVNNLDLDGNGEVDYIRVIDNAEGDVHAIVLQVPMGTEEAQDVAVIQLERKGEQSAMVQIMGSEDLYGPNVIVEPYEENAGNLKGRNGPSAPDAPPYMRVWVNVWDWSCVNWIYGPSYMVWVSPWHWDFYPPWWRPWRPYPYYSYWGWHRHYHPWYHYVNTCRVQQANALYGPRATHSPRVRTATNNRVQQRPANRRPGSGTMRSDDPSRRPQEARPQQRSDVPRTAPAEPRRGETRKAPAPGQQREARPQQRSPRTAPQQRSAPRQAPAPRPAPDRRGGR